MKVSEIKKQLKQGKELKEIIKIKNYIPVLEKKIFCENIINGSLEEKDGFLVCDAILKKFLMDLALLKNYGGIKFNDSFEKQMVEYDELCELGDRKSG
jgi:hypothetical protein